MSGYVTQFSGITNSNSATTVVTLSASVPAGDTLVASLVIQNTLTPLMYVDVVDSKDNKWRFIRSLAITGTDTTVLMLYAYIVSPLISGDTITFTHNDTADRVAVSVAQYNDALTADMGAEGDNGGVASTTLTTAATATTTDANELIVGAFGLISENRTFTATNGFTGLTKILTTNGSADRAIVAEYKYVASTGTYTADGTLNLSSSYAGIVQTFKLTAPPDARTGRPKAWNGSSWVDYDSKSWDGGAWNKHKTKGRAPGTWIGPFASNGVTVRYDSYDKIPIGSDATIGNTRFSLVSAGAPATATGIAGLHGNAIRFAVDATSNFASASFPLSPTNTQLYIRTYFRCSNHPPGNTGISTIRNSSNAALANIQLSTTGKVRIRNGSTLVATSTTTVTANQWVRMEWFWDGVAGSQSFRLFVGGNVEGATADETLTGLAAVIGVADKISVGIIDATTSTAYDLDEFAVDGDKWVDSK